MDTTKVNHQTAPTSVPLSHYSQTVLHIGSAEWQYASGITATGFESLSTLCEAKGEM